MLFFLSAWQLVLRRSLANWKLLSSIMVGVLVAVALLSSIPLYSNALNDLGLRHTLQQQTIELLDVDIYAPNYPVDLATYKTGWEFIDRQVSRNIKWLVRQEERWIKSQTFYAGWADRPIPIGPDRPKGHFHVFTNLEEHITLVEGRYADPLPAGLSQEELADPELEIEAMIGSEVAELFDVGVGDRLIFLSSRGEFVRQITIHLTGIIDPLDPGEEYWLLNTDIFSRPSDEGMVAPLFIPEQTFFDGISRIFPLSTATYHWFYYVDPARINTQNAETIGKAIHRMEGKIIAELPRSAVLTRVGGVIAAYQHKLMFTQIPLFILVFQIVGIVLYYVVTVASMVIERQSAEIALLRSRGASTGQIFNIFFMEGLLISALGGVVGPFLGAFVFSLLGKTAPFLPLTGGDFLPIRFSTSVFLLAAGAAALCLLALLVPAIQAARLSIVHQRQHAARPPMAPFWQRFYLDLVLLAFGGILYWELRERGSLVTRGIFGELGIDPLLLITPLLFMAAVAIVFLRLFPVIVSLAARLANYVTNASAVLSLRYMARNPVHYGRLILLLMMTASVGMFSASFLGTLEHSYTERVMYAAGSNIRLEGLYDQRSGKDVLLERYSDIPGVQDLSVVYRGSGRLGTLFTQVDFTLLAIDPKSFDQVAWYRDDFSEKTLPELMNLLAEDQPVDQGLDLPDETESIGLWVRTAGEYDNLRVFVKIKDGLGHYTDYELGSSASEDWEYLEASLRNERTNRLPPSPFSLRAIYVRGRMTGFGESHRAVYFDDLQVQGAFSSKSVVVEDFEDVLGWTVVADESSVLLSARGFQKDTFATNTEVFRSGTASGELSWISRRNFTSNGIYANLDTRPLAVLVSRSFLESTSVVVGQRVQIRLPGQFISAVIVDVVDYFPTLDPADRGFVLANLDRTLGLRNLPLTATTPFYPNEVWLTAAGEGEQRQVLLDTLDTAGFKARKLYDQAEMIAVAKADPLVAASWGGVLLITFLGVVLVSGLGFVVYAYLSARGRQLEFAILRTLGFSLRQIIGLVCFEQVIVIGAGMGIGTLIGSRLSSIMIPFLQLTEEGQRVLPPFVITIDWLTIGIAYIILTVAFVATVSLVILFFSRVALHQTLRMGEV